MKNLKQKVIYYFNLYKKEYIIALIIIMFITISIVMFLFFNSKNSIKEETKEIVQTEEFLNEVVIEEIKEIPEYVFVDIKGEVKKPGVYTVVKDSRVMDVINKAGGLTKNASTLANNLAKIVEDQMVIIIYSKEQIESFKKTKEEEQKIIEEATKKEEITNNDSVIELPEIDSNNNINVEDEIKLEENKISINKASKEELMKLTGIGESKANAIIEYREKNGQFLNLEDIMNVSGIGESAFNKLKNEICL